MTLTIKTLDFGRAIADSSFMVRGRAQGILVSAPVYGYLILGGEKPIVVDAGYRNADVLTRVGMETDFSDENSMEAQLDRYGVQIDEVGAVIATHLHADHAGGFHTFPSSTPLVVNRREIEVAASGIQGPMYAHEDMSHIMERAFVPGGVRYLDLDLTGSVEVAPGVRCELSGGHTEGSLAIYVDTPEGVACICGDIVYDIQDQLVAPLLELGYLEPGVSSNFTPSVRQEKAAIKRALCKSDFLLPSHDRGAKVKDGRIVGRLDGDIPGAVEPLPASGGYREVKIPEGAGVGS